MAAGLNPASTWAAMNPAYGSSSSRIRSSGLGAGEPAASRMSINNWTGAPVRSANRANVTSLNAENRSKTGSSRKSSEIWPLRIAAPRPSGGMPAAVRPSTSPTRRTWPALKRPSASGTMIPTSTSLRSSSGLMPAL